MKKKILLSMAFAVLFCLVLGTGTALAGGKYRADRHGYNKPPVIIYHVPPRVVHKHCHPAYARPVRVCGGRAYRPAYVHRPPVIVKQAPVYAPVYAPVRAGWGFSIHFGF